MSEYLGHDGNSDDERVQKRVFVRENLSCSSKIELRYYSTAYELSCIYCGTEGTNRTMSVFFFQLREKLQGENLKNQNFAHKTIIFHQNSLKICKKYLYPFLYAFIKMSNKG